MKPDSKRKGTGPMPPVLKKLGPGVVLRPKKDVEDAVEKQTNSLDYQPSEQVFRRKK